MPRFYSIEFRRLVRIADDGTLEQSSDEGIDVPGRTLGEMIANLEAMTGIRLIADDPPKYFRYINPANGIEDLVDVHISRRGNEICPKQDLDFLLEPEDIVEAGMLVC